jgi:hypothetical protein
MKELEITLILILPISLLLISIKWKIAFCAILAGIFSILAAWVSHNFSLVTNDIYYIYFITSSLLACICFITSWYEDYENRKSRKVYSGGMIRDEQIEKNMDDNDELIEFHRNKMNPRKRRPKAIPLLSNRNH